MYFVKHRADLFGLNNGKNLVGARQLGIAGPKQPGEGLTLNQESSL